MGCKEVGEFLEQNPNEWFTVREISERIGLSYNSITSSCKSLRKYQEVLWKNEPIKGGQQFKYKFKNENQTNP